MKKINYINKEQTIKLLDKETNIKYKVISLIMLDCGLRISECLNLKFENFDFRNKILNVKSLKKRGDIIMRAIPISDRLYIALAEYLKRFNNPAPNSYLFPSYGNSGHLCRKTVWRVLKRKGLNLGISNLHPHALRHTFATNHYASGTPLAEIKEMLGHKRYDTTLIYASIPQDVLKKRIELVTNPIKKGLFYNLKKRLFPPKKTKLINYDFNFNQFTIGRNDELLKIEDNINKEINTLILGNTGVGKSHILNNLKTNKKILRIDDTESIKKSLINILLWLKKDKNDVLELIYKNLTIDEIDKKIQRENTINLCTLINQSLKPKEYILIIDNITGLTPTAKKVIERIRDTFIMICAAREIKNTYTSFLWGFETININDLKRNDAITFINNHSINLEVEDLSLYRNHIYENTNGNPLAMLQMIDRYKKEPFLTNDIIVNQKHNLALKEYDFSFIIIISLAIITAMRYLSHELDEKAYRLIGSIGLILLIATRPLISKLTRKFI